MPHSELHKQKFKKNLIVLGIIVGMCLALFAITVIRMGPVTH
ncbi:MAG TPA: hypothetical protein PLO23_08190 [Alphaproteobacteria bacterium]|nr:hypothetical protein [Alphaproteobacteria bacterium]